MEKDKYIALIYKHLKAEISAEEQSELNAWLDDSPLNRDLADKVTADWEASQHYAPELSIDSEAEFEKLSGRVRQHKARQDVPAEVIKMKPRRKWLKWAAAAVAFVVTYAGVDYVMKDTFGLGVEWNTVQTLAGETKELVLPDGSQVWLNENTVFEYPVEFAGKSRKVKLNGEAYFDVIKDKSKQFSIELKEAKVSVLGTAFNLRAYAHQISIVLAVDEGRVRLQPNHSSRAAIVNVGEIGVYSSALSRLDLNADYDQNEAYWKTKELSFNDQSLVAALVTIRSKMDIDVKLEDEYMEYCRFSGNFPNATPQSVLGQIAENFGMELVEISEKEFELKGGECED